jgi:hypothetical protein
MGGIFLLRLREFRQQQRLLFSFNGIFLKTCRACEQNYGVASERLVFSLGNWYGLESINFYVRECHGSITNEFFASPDTE